MAPKSSVVSRSKQPSKEKEVVRELSPEQEISEEEEDPEEEEEEMFSENEIAKTTEPKSGSVPLNGFVSDSGSDYDSDDSNSGYKVQPITKLVTVSPAKRPISDSSNGGNLAKKAKTTTPSSKKSSNSGNNNNNNVSRIWHREDEIVLLKEMYEFKKAKGGVDLQLDMTAFYNSVKGKLDGEYSKEQFKSKIRHMRSKYLGIVKKGGDPGFATSHEALVFDLSKKAWGDIDKGKKNVDNVVNETVVVKGNGVVVGGKVVAKENAVVGGGKVVAKENGVVGGKVIAEVEEKGEKEGGEERFVCVPSYKFLKESVNVSLKYQQCLGLSDAAIKLMSENLGLIGAKNASQLDDEWKELFMEEVELNQKRASLVKKQVELVFSRIKKP